MLKKLSASLFVSGAALLVTACGGSSELEPASDADLVQLSYQFVNTENADSQEQTAGDITIGDGDILRHTLYSDARKTITSGENSGSLPQDVLEEVTQILNDSDFEPYGSKGTSCPNADSFELIVQWSDGTIINGRMNGAAFTGNFDGPCTANNTLRGDMQSTHEYLLNLVNELEFIE